jgi:hypothetical protein
MNNPNLSKYHYQARLLVALGVFAILVATFFIFTFKNIQQQNLATLTSFATLGSIKKSASYVVEVNQTGGVDSHIFTANIQDATNTQLIPATSFVSVRFQNPGGDIFGGGDPDWVGYGHTMWVGCKKVGYTLTYAQSPTGNQLDTYLIGIPQYPVGVEILNKSDNAIQITCAEDWSSWNQLKS